LTEGDEITTRIGYGFGEFGKCTGFVVDLGGDADGFGASAHQFKENLEQVGFGDDANEFARAHDRQAAQFFICHDTGSFFDGGINIDCDEFLAHDLFDGYFTDKVVHFPHAQAGDGGGRCIEKIAFRNDTNHLAVFDDWGATDVFFLEHNKRIMHRSFRCDSNNRVGHSFANEHGFLQRDLGIL